MGEEGGGERERLEEEEGKGIEKARKNVERKRRTDGREKARAREVEERKSRREEERVGRDSEEREKVMRWTERGKRDGRPGQCYSPSFFSI